MTNDERLIRSLEIEAQRHWWTLYPGARMLLVAAATRLRELSEKAK